VGLRRHGFERVEHAREEVEGAQQRRDNPLGHLVPAGEGAGDQAAAGTEAGQQAERREGRQRLSNGHAVAEIGGPVEEQGEYAGVDEPLEDQARQGGVDRLDSAVAEQAAVGLHRRRAADDHGAEQEKRHDSGDDQHREVDAGHVAAAAQAEDERDHHHMGGVGSRTTQR
jgi:hypothetical protein